MGVLFQLYIVSVGIPLRLHPVITASTNKIGQPVWSLRGKTQGSCKYFIRNILFLTLAFREVLLVEV